MKRRKRKPEPSEKKRLAQLLKNQAGDLADYHRIKQWFNQKVRERYEPLWKLALQDALENNSEELSEKEIKKNLADFAEKQATSLDVELNSMLTRTSVIVAATTLLLAAFTFKTAPGLAGLMMMISISLAGFAFIRSLTPVRPPYKRSKVPYEPGHVFNLLVYDSFTRYLYYNMLYDRRAPIIQKYKRAHGIAIPVVVGASICAVAGLAWTQGLSFFGG